VKRRTLSRRIANLQGHAAAGYLLVRAVAGGDRQLIPESGPVTPLPAEVVSRIHVPRQLPLYIYRRDSSNVPADRHDAQHGF